MRKISSIYEHRSILLIYEYFLTVNKKKQTKSQKKMNYKFPWVKDPVLLQAAARLQMKLGSGVAVAMA